MTIRTRFIILYIISQIIFKPSVAQEKLLRPVKIGDKVPIEIWKTVSVKKGTKLVLLDFWSTWCSSCIEAFPRISKLQEKFKNGFQIVLINSWENEMDANRKLKAMNSKFSTIEFKALNITSIFLNNGAKRFKSIFPIYSIPHHIWLNEKGIVLSITFGYNNTDEHIEAMLKGSNPNMIVKDDELDNENLLEDGILLPVSELLPPIYYSGFMGYCNTSMGESLKIDSAKKNYKSTLYNNGVINLYKNAFRTNGKLRYILEAKDSYKYLQPKDDNFLDSWKRNYVFTYEIQGSLIDKDHRQQIMQIDLNRFFGNLFNIEGVIQKRTFKGLVLIKIKDGLLKSLGETQDYHQKENYFRITNYSFIEAVQLLTSNFEDMNSAIPFLNESEVEDSLKVDMQMSGDLKNLENVRKQLHQYGLDIIKADREVEVLVIKDKIQASKIE